MAGSWTSERFPAFEPAIRRLADQHRELKDEPLHLAIAYLPARRDQQHVFLFEVIGERGDWVSPDHDLFEVTFTGTSGFPLASDERLHLILTTPHELAVALREGWPLAKELVNALRSEDYKVMHADEVGERALATLVAEAKRQEAVHHG